MATVCSERSETPWEQSPGPNVGRVLDRLAPERAVVYGVALDACDRYAVEGLLARGGLEIVLVADATAPIGREEGERLLTEWAKRGVRIARTADVTGGRLAA